MRRLLTALALASFGCRTPTQVTVEVTTDVPCSDTPGTTIGVARLGALEAAAPLSSKTTCTNGRVGALVIVPSGDRKDEIAIRVVTGVKTDPNTCVAPSYKGCVVARRALHFIEHTELVVRVLMRSSCLDVPCREDRTCVKGECVDSKIDPHACEGSGCDESALGPSVDAGPPDSADAGDGGETGLPITGDTAGLMAGSPWPMLNGSPTLAGSTTLLAPKTSGLLWQAGAPGAQTANVVGKDGLIIYGDAAAYTAIDPATRKEKWKTLVKGGVAADPALGSDGVLYGAESGGFVAIDPSSGALLWSLPTKATGDIALGPGPRAYMAGSTGISAVNPATRTELWFDTSVVMDSGPSLSSDGKLYVGSLLGEIRQYDAATGKRGWTFPSGGDLRTPVIVGENGMVYTVVSTAAYAIDVVTGLERWHTELGAVVHYALARGPDGTLYAATRVGNVLALDPNKGTVLWTAPLGGDFTAPIVVDRNSVVLASNGSTLFALDGKAKGKQLFGYPSTNVVALAPGADNLLYVLRVGSLDALGP